MQFSEILEKRRATKFFDKEKSLSKETIEAVLNRARLAPSGFNLQSWRFLVVQDEARKIALKKAAFDQPKVAEASAVVVVCGETNAWKEAERITSDMVTKGHFPKEAQGGYIKMIENAMAKEQAKRDAVFRDAMLAAATILYSALEEGIVAAPMSGFDPQKLKETFALPESVIPILLIAMGHEKSPNPKRPMRKELSEILSYDEWTLPRP